MERKKARVRKIDKEIERYIRKIGGEKTKQEWERKRKI